MLFGGRRRPTGDFSEHRRTCRKSFPVIVCRGKRFMTSGGEEGREKRKEECGRLKRSLHN